MLLTFLPILTHSLILATPVQGCHPTLPSDKTKYIDATSVSFYAHVPLELVFIKIIWLTIGPCGCSNKSTVLLRNDINLMYIVLQGFQNIFSSKSHGNAPFYMMGT